MNTKLGTILLIAFAASACRNPISETGSSYSLTADDDSKWNVQVFGQVADPQGFAKKIVAAAVKARREQSLDWFGKEAPELPAPIPVKVTVVPGSGGGGATSYITQEMEKPRLDPHDFKMDIEGSEESLLTDVVPHEVMHTIYASQFGHIIPRWADEGTASDVEGELGRSRLYEHLRRYFNQKFEIETLFSMTEYPGDPQTQDGTMKILLMYAQGYHIVRFLEQKHSKQKFTAFLFDVFDAVKKGSVRAESWRMNLKKHFGYDNPLTLDGEWLEWFLKGAPDIPKAPEPEVLVNNDVRIFIDDKIVMASMPQGSATALDFCLINSEQKCAAAAQPMKQVAAKYGKQIYLIEKSVKDSFAVEITTTDGQKSRQIAKVN